MDRDFHAIVNNHCILNAPRMKKWVDMSIETRTTQERERETWKRAHGGRRAPVFPRDLANFSNLIDVEWIHDAMTKARAQGQELSPKEWEYARGCLPKVCYCDFCVCCICGFSVSKDIQRNWFCRVLHSTLCGRRDDIFAHEE